MSKSNGGTRTGNALSPQAFIAVIPKNYRMIREDNGFGIKRVTSYVSKEDNSVVIEVERGALRHDNPTGFDLKKGGELFGAYLTLSEAKDWAEYYAKRNWKK